MSTTSTNSVLVMLEGLEDLIGDLSPLLAEAGLSSKDLPRSPESRFPTIRARLLWDLVERISGIENPGFQLGKCVRFGAYPLLDYGGESCSTLLDALRLYKKFSPIIWEDWKVDLLEKPMEIELRIFDPLPPHSTRNTIEFAFTLLVDRFARYSNNELRLQKVMFRHQASGKQSDYLEFFDCPVEFGANFDALCFDPMISKTNCRNNNSFVLNVFLKGAVTVMTNVSLSRGGSLKHRLGAYFHNHLGRAKTDLKNAANELGMSSRTLQRRLAENGLTFSDLLDDVRRSIITEHISDDSVHLDELADGLGFANRSALDKACQRWFGKSAAEMRSGTKF